MSIRDGGRSGPPSRGIHQREPAFELVYVKWITVHSLPVHQLDVDTRGRARRPSPTRNSSTENSSGCGMRSLRQLTKVVNTEHIVVMPGDQPAATRVIAIRNRCTNITSLNATSEKHRGIRHCRRR